MTVRHVNPLRWVIELFSVVTGIAFVLSGLLNSLTFALQWQISYFSVASPSDVIMSGFMTTIVALFAAMSVIALLHFVIMVEMLEKNSRNAAIFRFERIHPNKHWPLVFSLIRRKILGGGPSSIFAVCILLVGIYAYHSSPLSGFGSPYWYETGLNVADRPGDNPCDGAHVAWLGSSAAVLECEDGVRVIHSLDSLETVRRFR